MKEMSDLICGKAAVGGNYNSTRDTMNINLFGYNISLMNVAVYGVLGSLILWFIFRLFK